MKKSLLALAVASALPGLALAQSSVTLSGNFKVGIAQTKLSNGVANASGLTSPNNGSITGMHDGSSRFILSGVEDLGGGLKGIFQMDQRFAGDESRNNYGANGNSFVGLAGGFGQVRLGKLDLYYGYGTDEHGIRATALQHSNISLLSYVNSPSVAIARASRSTNVVRYDSPALGPVTLGLSYSPNAGGGEGGTVAAPAGGVGSLGALGATGDGQKGQAVQGDVNFNMGAIRAGLAVWDEKTEGYKTFAAGAATGQRAVRGWGGYNFGMFDVGLTLDRSKITGTEVQRDAISVPLKANLGPGALLFTYTVARDTKTNGTKNADTGAKMWSLGYDYGLSKRTSLGISYAVIDNKANASYQMFTNNALGNVSVPTAGQDTKQLYLGVRHAF